MGPFIGKNEVSMRGLLLPRDDLKNLRIEDWKNLRIEDHRGGDRGFKPKVEDQATKNAEFGK